MAHPSFKHEQVEIALQEIVGGDRRIAIAHNLCFATIGCGNAAHEFRDEISRREYAISGLCQSCQDEIFKPEENDD